MKNKWVRLTVEVILGLLVASIGNNVGGLLGSVLTILGAVGIVYAVVTAIQTKKLRLIVLAGFLLVFFGVILYGVIIYFSQSHPAPPTASSSGQADPANGQLTAGFLSALLHYADEGYLSDQLAAGTNSNDLTDLMTSLIQEIDDENVAVATISPYASSTDAKITTAAQVLAVTEQKVITEQQIALDALRQISNGTLPANSQYDIAQLQAAQQERNNELILVTAALPGITMHLGPNADASSTETVGPLDPSGVLSAQQKSDLTVAAQTELGDALNSNQNDIFLLLAQEVYLLVTSPTYTDFHNTWMIKAANLAN